MIQYNIFPYDRDNDDANELYKSWQTQFFNLICLTDSRPEIDKTVKYTRI